jgi:elongator complex protein 3
MAEAERIASEEYGVEKLLVMSALGTKRYYERLGYRRDGVYVSKPL